MPALDGIHVQGAASFALDLRQIFQRSLDSHVLSLRAENLKILRSVIKAVAIDVVHHLAGHKSAPDGGFGNEAIPINVSAARIVPDYGAPDNFVCPTFSSHGKECSANA